MRRMLSGILAALLPAGPATATAATVTLHQTNIVAPIVLSQANTTYRLANDLTAAGTAFVVAARGVTLDLNGKTVTYGAAPAPVVPNGGFEQPAADPSKPAGWDVSAAPAAKRVAARTGLFGQWMLSLADFQSSQTITSDWVPIADPLKDHAAVVFPRGTSNVTVTLRILGPTGAELHSAALPPENTGRGFAPVALFVPPAGTSRVRVQVTAAVPAGQTGSVDLDGVTLTRAREYGVMATTSRNPGTARPTDTPAVPMALATVPGYWNAGRFAVRNGAIVQGAGRAFAGNPLNFTSLNGATVDRVRTFATGIDTDNLNGRWVQNLDVRGSVFDADVPAVTRRMNGYGAIRLQDSGGELVIADNTIRNSPMCGVYLVNHRGNAAPVRVVGNDIRQAATASDGYGVLVCGLDKFEIGHNTVHPVTGRGLLIDGFNKLVTRNGDVHDNVFAAYETPNLEYGPNGLEATALRMRNYRGEHRDIVFRNNVFAARTDAAGVNQAIGCRVTFDGREGQMKGANLRFENNTFRATVETPASDRTASAVSLASVSPGVGVRFFGNTFESNHRTLAVGDSDTQFANEDVVFVSNVHRKAGAPARPDFATTVVGALNFPAKDIRLIDAKFEGGADAAVTFVGTGEKLVGVGPVVRVNVTAGGTPAAGATVTVYDRDNATVGSVTTDPSGRAAIAVLTAVHSQTAGTQPATQALDARGPFRVEVGHGGKAQTRTTALSGSPSMDFGF